MEQIDEVEYRKENYSAAKMDTVFTSRESERENYDVVSDKATKGRKPGDERKAIMRAYQNTNQEKSPCAWAAIRNKLRTKDCDACE